MIGENEAKITINGVELNNAQAITVRVAISAFLSTLLNDKCLGNDDHGKEMAPIYMERSNEILALIHKR